MAELCFHGETECGSLTSVIIPASWVADFQAHMATGFPEFGPLELPGMEFSSPGLESEIFHMNHDVSKTLTCPPAPEDVEGREAVVSVQMSSATAREKRRKRRANKKLKTKVVAGSERNYKKIKLSEESSSSSSKKNSDLQKTDYIHVRARPGQATDSHSLAERARRERISKKMKYLQNLVPGCDKITGNAGRLDEIINYVRSLQHQVEFLSMKLAAFNPILDFSNDLFAKQQFQASSTWDADFQSLICSMNFEPAYLSGFVSNTQLPMKEEM